MSELKPRITENGIDYILVGDYYIPDLKLPEEHRPIGKYGRMHREYLREAHPARLNTLTLTGELWTYLADLNEQAQERLDTIMEQMKAADGVTEELKRTHQMNDLFIQGLTIDWNRVRPYNYVRQIPAISGIDTFTFHKPITFFVGENGSGKSTLLEAIAVAYGFNAEGGTKNYSFSTYNSHSELCEAMTISKGYRRPKFGYFLRAESFYNVATKEIDYSDDDHPSKGYHQKSHGESFLAIAQDYMGADGVYIFDEPEAALSPQRQLTLLINIYRCAQEGAQFIIVSHSPILLGMPDAEIFSFDNGTIHPCQYEDTDSYVITKTFVNNRQHFLNQLLNEET